MATDDQQHWNAAGYAHHARFVADLGRPLNGLLDPKPGETILDLGCGDGVLTAEIQRLGARVSGVDGAPAMVEAARELGIDARLMDAQTPDLPERFDAASTPLGPRFISAVRGSRLRPLKHRRWCPDDRIHRIYCNPPPGPTHARFPPTERRACLGAIRGPRQARAQYCQKR